MQVWDTRSMAARVAMTEQQAAAAAAPEVKVREAHESSSDHALTLCIRLSCVKAGARRRCVINRMRTSERGVHGDTQHTYKRAQSHAHLGAQQGKFRDRPA